MSEKYSRLKASLQKILLSAIILMLTAPSCVNRKDRTKHEDLIPDKEFVSILSEIYMANGLLTLPQIRKTFSARDSVLNYMDIIESHGYTYEKMNSTMNYYFISRPKKLIRIYDQVLERLNRMQLNMQNELMRQTEEESRKQTNYNIYYYPDIERKDNPGSSIMINFPGTYIFTLSVTVYPDDQSLNPHFSAWLVPADSINTGKKIWLPSMHYVKDGQPHQVLYTGQVKQDRPMIMKTFFYDYDNNIDEWDRHARIEMIFSNFSASPR